MAHLLRVLGNGCIFTAEVMMSIGLWIFLSIVIFLLVVAIYDVLQKRHAILRNFPLVGHLRYIVESVGPELRQYIITTNDEERPFSRDQRSWVYASAKQANNYFSFGTDNNLESRSDYIIVKHTTFPTAPPEKEDPQHTIPCAKVWGAARGRKKAFRPDSIISISGMSYGSLSWAAVESLNRGAHMAKVLHNTGEGGISPYHDRGGDLIYQLGTGYYGARTKDGLFDLEMLIDKVQQFNVKAIEIKLSQGAKPGRGGAVPAAKMTRELSEIRGVPYGQDAISPSRHSAFSDVDSMLDFVEKIGEATGVPVGIKSAVGDLTFWDELTHLMATTDRGVDFVQIDGGEGGTGAAPLAFSDHVSLPFKVGFPRVYKRFAREGLTDDVVFLGSGRLGFPVEGAFALALGCDMIAVAREAMLAIGCIQAQRCHTGACPTGVTTHNKWLVRGLDPTDKSARLANYMLTFRKELMWLVHAAGKHHPYELVLEDFELLGPNFTTEPARSAFGYEPLWRLPDPEVAAELRAMMGT